MYTLYTKKGCNYCKKAIEHLEKKKQKYKVIEVTDNNRTKIYEKIDSKTDGYRYFPIIFKDNKFIGGYTELISDITIPEGNKVTNTPFKGNPEYNLKVMKYLAHKYNKDCVVIPDNRLKGSLKQSEVSLRWNEENVDGYISIPKGFWKSLDKCKGKRRFIIFPFGFTCMDGTGHANYMIYDYKTKNIERFEPYGYKPNKCINAPGLDEAIYGLLKEKWEINNYYKPLDFMPKIGPQTIQKREKDETDNDPTGFCSMWAAWYADLRLANPDTPRDEIIKRAIEELNDRPETFTEFIRNYSTIY